MAVSAPVGRLFNHVAELVQSHERLVRSSKGCAGLFDSEITIVRNKLCDACVQLVFSDPLGCGMKTAESLWRKAFYDVISAVKQLKQATWSPVEQELVLQLLRIGRSTFQHVLSRLKAELPIPPFAANDLGPYEGDREMKFAEDELSAFALHLWHKCFLWLGDLARYEHDFNSESNAINQAVRYYSQAVWLLPDVGMPFNQMGSLSGERNDLCDSVYFYMRCLQCSVPFEGAVKNLHRLLHQNALDCMAYEKQKHIKGGLRYGKKKLFAMGLLTYCDFCYTYPNTCVGLPFSQLCKQVLESFQAYLDLSSRTRTSEIAYPNTYRKKRDNPSCSPTRTADTHEQVDADFLRKVFLMFLMSYERMKHAEGELQKLALATTLTSLSYLVQFVVTYWQGTLLVNMDSRSSSVNGHWPEGDSHSTSGSASSPIVESSSQSSSESGEERRRSLKSSGKFPTKTQDKDTTSVPPLLHLGLSQDSVDSLCSEMSMCSSKADSNEDDSRVSPTPPLVINGVCNTMKNGSDVIAEIETSCAASPFQVIDQIAAEEFMSTDQFLSVIKLGCDWLRSSVKILVNVHDGTEIFMKRICNLLNLLGDTEQVVNMDRLCPNIWPEQRNWDSVKWCQRLPLLEDVSVRGISVYDHIHQDIDFQQLTTLWLTPTEETCVRIASLQHFGWWLSKQQKIKFWFDPLYKQFSVVNPRFPVKRTAKVCENKKQELMHNMAQLWLQSEIQNLEQDMNSMDPVSLLPLYLIPETNVLVHHLPLVRKLVATRHFIMVIPFAVIQVLDRLKREAKNARGAIRYLESQFQKGNKFFRAQKKEETLPLDETASQGRKELHSWAQRQILECCHYFAKNAPSKETDRDSAFTMATLLVSSASSGNSNKVSLETIAQAAGLSCHHVDEFLSKWRNSCKSRG